MAKRPGFLIVTWGPNKGTIIPLGAGQRVWIGRRNEAFTQTDSRMSRIHFRLKPHGETWIVEDQRSSNGTFLNGKAIHGPQTLTDGDLIQAGRTLIAFCRIAPSLLAGAGSDPMGEAGTQAASAEAAADAGKGKGDFWPRMFRRRRAAGDAQTETLTEVPQASDLSDESPTQIIAGQPTASSESPSDVPTDAPTDLEDAEPADAWAQALRSEITQRDQEPDFEADETFDESDDPATTNQNGSAKKREKASSIDSTRSRSQSRKGRPLATEDDFNSTILGTDEQLSMVLKDDED